MQELVKLQISIRFNRFIGRLTWADGEISEYEAPRIEEILFSISEDIVTWSETTTLVPEPKAKDKGETP